MKKQVFYSKPILRQSIYNSESCEHDNGKLRAICHMFSVKCNMKQIAFTNLIYYNYLHTLCKICFLHGIKMQNLYIVLREDYKIGCTTTCLLASYICCQLLWTNLFWERRVNNGRHHYSTKLFNVSIFKYPINYYYYHNTNLHIS